MLAELTNDDSPNRKQNCGRGGLSSWTERLSVPVALRQVVPPHPLPSSESDKDENLIRSAFPVSDVGRK